VLLKLTHLPYVVAISVFEHGYDYIRSRPNARDTFTAAPGGPEAGIVTKRHLFKPALLSPRQAAPATQLRTSTPTEVPRPKSAAFESDDDLRSLVNKLSVQVEQLTVLVTQIRDQQTATTE
jgi:hypothetical protein